MNFIKKLFSNQSDEEFVEQFLEDIFQACGFSLSCDKVVREDNTLIVEIYGEDEDLLLEKGGRGLQAVQVYLSAVLQSRMRRNNLDKKIFVRVDSGGFLKQYEEDLLRLAVKLKKEALRKRRPVLLKKPLSAFYRRQIHQMLTEDGSVKTKSIGEGLFKTIKILPLQGKSFQ